DTFNIDFDEDGSDTNLRKVSSLKKTRSSTFKTQSRQGVSGTSSRKNIKPSRSSSSMDLVRPSRSTSRNVSEAALQEESKAERKRTRSDMGKLEERKPSRKSHDSAGGSPTPSHSGEASSGTASRTPSEISTTATTDRTASLATRKSSLKETVLPKKKSKGSQQSLSQEKSATESDLDSDDDTDFLGSATDVRTLPAKAKGRK
ncbi:hypothetical protein EGW08_022801, partial [Elysia chlorotica]